MSAPIDRAHALLYDLKRPELAEQELRKALAANPGDALAQTMLANSLGRQGKLDDAEAAVGEAMRLAPDYSVAHRIRAWLIELRGRYDEAEPAYREAIRLDPAEVYNYQALAYVLHMMGRHTEALQVANQGLALRADDVWCLNRRAQALVRLDRLDLAQKAIDAALRIDPSLSLTYCNQGWIWAHRGKTFRALRAYRTALELDPNETWARTQCRRSLLRIASGIFFVLLVAAIALGATGLSHLAPDDQDKPWTRVALGATAVLALTGALGMGSDALKFALIGLTDWRRFAATPEEMRSGQAEVRGYIVFSLILVIAWTVWPSVRGAVAGTVALGSLIVLWAKGLHENKSGS